MHGTKQNARSELPKQSYHKISLKQAFHDTRLLRDYLAAYLQKHDIDIRAMAWVTRGGGVPGTFLAYALGITDIGTICVKSYDKLDQGKVEIKHDLVDTIKAIAGPQGEHLLVVDDLADGGRTAKAIRERYPKATIVAPYVKAKEDGIKALDAWAVQIPGDTWYAFKWSEDEANSAVPAGV
jgi:xanthine phosphoribosyltransferase